MFRFREEYKELVDSSGSVRGANRFACWSDYLWFDIDAEEGTKAVTEARKLLMYFDAMSVLDYTVVFFSGSKGFHIGVSSLVFPFEPAVNLPAIMGALANMIAEKARVSIDGKIYNHNRLWRIPGSVHGKTGLRKVQLEVKDIL